MVVQHNITAMNANRMFGIVDSEVAKSTEKLSSGFQINRAADDASGLSISEKMRKQVRGLTQASSNAQDGISMVQTAEGALNEVHDMLHRMNELAVKAANGTMSASDREDIQNEVDEILDEIDRVSSTTKFNEIYLLDGDPVNSVVTDIQAKDGVTADVVGYTAVKDLYLVNGNTYNGKIDAGKDIVNLLNSDRDSFNTSVFEENTDRTISTDPSVKYLTNNGEIVVINGALDEEFRTKIDKISSNGIQLDRAIKIKQVTLSSSNFSSYINDNGSIDGFSLEGLYTKNSDGSFTAHSLSDVANSLLNSRGDESWVKVNGRDDYGLKDELEDGTQATAYYLYPKTDANGTQNKLDDTTFNSLFKVYTANGPITTDLQVGADNSEDNRITIKIKQMNTVSIGVGGLKVNGDTPDNARNAIDRIATGIQRVSEERSKLGAYQNRLEHTIKNLDNVVENTTASESAIRDADMAKEMVKFSKNQILLQASQAMLAQANQSTQGALSLLG